MAIIEVQYLEDQGDEIEEQRLGIRETHDDIKRKLLNLQNEYPNAFSTSPTGFSEYISEPSKTVMKHLDDVCDKVEKFDKSAVALFQDFKTNYSDKITAQIKVVRDQLKIGPGFTFDLNSPVVVNFKAECDSILGDLEESKVKGLFDTIGEDRKARDLEDYINSLKDNPEQLDQELALIEKILREWGSYGKLNREDAKRYKDFMAYYYLLCNFKVGLNNTMDKGYCQLNNLTYEDGKFKGTMNLLSPDAVKRIDKNSRPDGNSISQYVNNVEFEIHFFPNTKQIVSDGFKNLVGTADLGGDVAEYITSELIGKANLPGLSTALGVVDLIGSYETAKNENEANKLQKTYEEYVNLFGYELVVNKSSNRPTIYEALPSSTSEEKIKVLLEIAQQNGIDVNSYMKGETISPKDALDLYEIVKEKSKGENFIDKEEDFQTKFNN